MITIDQLNLDEQIELATLEGALKHLEERLQYNHYSKELIEELSQQKQFMTELLAEFKQDMIEKYGDNK